MNIRHITSFKQIPKHPAKAHCMLVLDIDDTVLRTTLAPAAPITSHSRFGLFNFMTAASPSPKTTTTTNAVLDRANLDALIAHYSPHVLFLTAREPAYYRETVLQLARHGFHFPVYCCGQRVEKGIMMRNIVYIWEHNLNKFYSPSSPITHIIVIDDLPHNLHSICHHCINKHPYLTVEPYCIAHAG